MVEPVEHAGRVVAAVLEIPLVEHGWGFTLPAAMTQAGTQSLRDVYSAAGVTPRHPALTIDLGPEQMQAGDAPAVDRYRYTPWSPPGRRLPPAEGKLRLLVTLGTYAHPDAASLLRAVVACGRDHGAQVVAVPGNSDRGSAADFPADVSVPDWVDMVDAVASCDVVVHHGGAGTSWISLLTGRAALVIPQAGDQFRNAHLLEQAGVARVIDTDRCDTSAIRRGLDELTSTPALANEHGPSRRRTRSFAACTSWPR